MIIEDIKRILDSEEHNDSRYLHHDLEHYELDNIEILDKIYNKASQEERKVIIEILVNHPIWGYYLPFEFLIRKRFVSEAFLGLSYECAKSKRPSTLMDYYQYLDSSLRRLYFLIKTEEFSHEELENIKRHLNSYDSVMAYGPSHITAPTIRLKDSILKEITLKNAELVKERYSGELLSEDIDKTIDLTKEFGFDENISNLIQKLKNFYYECDDDIKSNIYATKVRDVMMEIIKNICFEISKGEKIENKDEKYRKYLLEKDVINHYEEKFVSNFYSFLSELNNHSISTPKEYFRLSIIMVSEISLILLYKYKEYKMKIGLK